MHLSAAIHLFLQHCRIERGLSNLSTNAYQIDLRQFLAIAADTEELCVADIDKHHIRTHLNWLNTRYKPRSIKRKIATLKSFFAFLEQEEYVETSPFRKLRLRMERAKSLPRTLPVTSVERLLASAYKARRGLPPQSETHLAVTRDIAVLETLFSTGVRVSELCRLKTTDVDLEQQRILVMGKGKRERVIPLCEEATLRALGDYRTSCAEFLRHGDAFFLNRNKRPLSDQSVRLIIRKYQRLSRIPENATPHMFRHTIATLLLENGVDIRNIQTLLGHSSLAVTEIYTHVSVSAQREALGKGHPRQALNLKGDYR